MMRCFQLLLWWCSFVGGIKRTLRSRSTPIFQTPLTLYLSTDSDYDTESGSNNNSDDIIRVVPIVNSLNMDISATNPFGPAVSNVQDARQEILALLLNSSYVSEEFTSMHHFRIEYLVKYLESRYVPIQTTSFLSFALNGRWKSIYSNVLTRHADSNLGYLVHQTITADDTSMGGLLANVITWNLSTPAESADGDLVIKTEYTITSKGGLQLTLKDHTLLPNLIPSDVQGLIMSIQRTVPFDFFDPTDSTLQHTYLDPEIRIVRVTGPIFYGVVNIFVKVLEEGPPKRMNV